MINLIDLQTKQIFIAFLVKLTFLMCYKFHTIRNFILNKIFCYNIS